MYRLVVLLNHSEQVLPVLDAEVRLGRSSENDLVLRVPGVSRVHALVRRCPGGLEFTDLGSKNGLFVDGRRVERTLLTPGLQVQIGAAWVELEELSTSEERLLAALDTCLSGTGSTSEVPESIMTQPPATKASSPEAALRLAYHLDFLEGGEPIDRAVLLARVRSVLGAQLLASLHLQRNGTVDTIEFDGLTSVTDVERTLSPILGEWRVCNREEVRLKRIGAFLLGGRGRYLLAARFSSEPIARSAWRRDFFRFVAMRHLAPAKPLRERKLAEIRRVLAATGGNKSDTARILGVTRQTIYAAIKRIRRAGSE